jgi:hypothetical protein
MKLIIHVFSQLISASVFTLVGFSAGASGNTEMPMPVLVAEGKFVGQGLLHRIKGDINIIQLDQSLTLNFSSDFKVTAGPDLRVVLRDSKNKHAMIVLEKLKSVDGAQSYLLPVNLQVLAEFDQISIYCQKFHVDFGVAEIQFK